MKRIGLFRDIIMLATVCLCLRTGAYAADIEIKYQTVGNEVTFAVWVNAQNNVKAFGFDILYDTNLLKYQAYDKNGFLTQDFEYFDVNEFSPGKVRIGGFDKGEHIIQKDANGILVTLKFEILGDGIYELEITNLEDDIQNWSTENGTVDAYEPDNIYTESQILDSKQVHNFHVSGDSDWIWFYGIPNETYTIQATPLGSQCDPVIEVFDMNGSARLEWKNDGGTGAKEVLAWNCPGDGIYYVKATHSDPNIFGKDTAYELDIIFPRQDAYEIDDALDTARVITINGKPQQHNFWNENDTDWVKFYGLPGVSYTIQAIDVESNCNVVIELYDSDKTTQLELKNDGNAGADEILDWTCNQEGIYYVKAVYDSSDKSHAREGSFGGYALQVLKSGVSGDIGEIKGKVINAITQSPIPGVTIKTNGEEPNTGISGLDGRYDIQNHITGEFTLTAVKDGYKEYQESTVGVEDGDRTELNIFMCPLCNGDIDNSGKITPGDARNAFEKYMGICPTSDKIECKDMCCDVNVDGKCTPGDALIIFKEYMSDVKPSCLD